MKMEQRVSKSTLSPHQVTTEKAFTHLQVCELLKVHCLLI